MCSVSDNSESFLPTAAAEAPESISAGNDTSGQGRVVDLSSGEGGFAHRIGLAVRELRKSRQMTIKQLAEATELSISFISQFERGKSGAHFNSLLKIAHALGTDAHDILSRAEVVVPEEPLPMLAGRNGVSVSVTSQGVVRALSDVDREMSALEFKHENASGWDGFSVHDSDEFVYVAEGKIEFEFRGESLRLLQAGDSLYYGPNVSHRWRALDPGPVRVLTVQTRMRPTPAIEA